MNDCWRVPALRVESLLQGSQQIRPTIIWADRDKLLQGAGSLSRSQSQSKLSRLGLSWCLALLLSASVIQSSRTSTSFNHSTKPRHLHLHLPLRHCSTTSHRSALTGQSVSTCILTNERAQQLHQSPCSSNEIYASHRSLTHSFLPDASLLPKASRTL